MSTPNTTLPCCCNTSANSTNSNSSWPTCKLLLGGAALLSAAAAAYYTYTHYRNKPSAPSTSTPSGSRSVIRIGTRTSALALWQANHVCDLLRARYPHITFEVVGMNTLGDIDQIKPLTDFDSKGVFTKELDIALLNGSIDIAVHCMKDLPTTLPTGLYMGSVLERGDVEDAVVISTGNIAKGYKTLADLPAGSVIGTSALRRTAALASRYPALKCQNVRGNVNTRLMKLDRGDYDALLLARVGLKRLGLESRINQVLDSESYGYAVGQGALAILCREDDAAATQLLQPLTHEPTMLACEAERALLRRLQGGCKVPIAVRTTLNPSLLSMWSAVMSVDGKLNIEQTQSATLNGNTAEKIQAAIGVGDSLAVQLLSHGADALLAGLTQSASEPQNAVPVRRTS